MSPKSRERRSRRGKFALAPPVRSSPSAAAGASRGATRPAPGHRLATWTLWLLLIAVPFVLDSAQKDAFRLPKALLGQTLALLSLFFLSFAWARREAWAELARAPFVAIFGPFLAVATLVSLASPHLAHVQRGLAGLWIGALAIWGWSVGFSRRELREALSFALAPAAVLGAVAVLQFHGLYHPYNFAGIADSSRFAIGSLAGNVGDLSACLVLPVILAQADIVRRRRLGLSIVALVLCLYGLIVTQTFSAIAGVAAGTLVFWTLRVSRRRAVGAAATIAAAVLVLLAVVGPFRQRSVEKVGQIARGDWNSVLTGRLDGWRAAAWMVREHPATGVGVGAFRTEFVPAKSALLRAGVPFFREQLNVVFANAHNDLLEVAAETGWPGLLAFTFGLALLARRLFRWRRPGSTGGVAFGTDSPAALAWAGIAAVGVVSLANFPFHIAISFWPIALFVAWLVSLAPEDAAPPTGSSHGGNDSYGEPA